jgi:hypothetical protein
MSVVSEENKAAAAGLKAKANEAFKSTYTLLSIKLGLHISTIVQIDKNFMEAATLYGQALEKNDQDATIWCNRAFARMNLVLHSINDINFVINCIIIGRIWIRARRCHESDRT